MNVKAYSLFSGSTGNSFFVRTDSASILIDAGGSERRIARALCSVGASLDDISAIFITHEHTDHVAALESIVRRRPVPVHMTAGTARAVTEGADVALLCAVVPHRGNFSVTVGDITVSSFDVPHDSAQPVGFLIDAGGVRIGYATDTGCVTQEMKNKLSGCDAAVIEANHDVGMLMTGPYPYRLKIRILEDDGHLSNDDAAILASFLAESGVKSVMLAHLSQKNNTENLALRTVEELSDVRLCAASPNTPVELTLL